MDADEEFLPQPFLRAAGWRGFAPPGRSTSPLERADIPYMAGRADRVTVGITVLNVRCLVTGTDDAGRSCVVSERDITFLDLGPGLSVDGLFKTTQNPLPSRPEGRGDLIDLGVAPGLCGWSLTRFEPGAEVGMHYTDTLDFDVVLDGTVELILDDGTHPLETGDCVVMTGVDHAWRAGPTGCTINGVAIGSPPPQ